MVDIVVCENPKHSLKLLNNLGIKKKLFSLHDYNENILIKRIEKYQLNSSIALISDAGSPLISDPGYKLVLDYINKKLMVTTIPGPSSVISALQLSGLPMHNFKFYGFVSKTNAMIKSLAKEVAGSSSTSVLFVSGSRIMGLLKILSEIKINRGIAVCKEMTKKNEMVFRGSVKEVSEQISSEINNFKGEFVVIVGGSSKKIMKIDYLIQQQIESLLKKFSLTEVVEIVHKLTSISKKEIYKTALVIKND